MNIYLVLLIIFAIIAIVALIYFSGFNKLKKYKEKMDKAESLIDTNLNKKLDLIININSEVKKVTGKKDYLKEYISIRDLIIQNIEKDLKLEEAEKLINDLMTDFIELNNDVEFNNLIKNLRDIDEILVSAKNMFNQNAVLSNQLIKTFPNNIVAKISKFRIRSFYSNNKTDDGETF
ncbi:MAG: LemA family protein [Firmicutes bacterium]|nr:LemA family protein [Bacillota bacterium]